MRTIRIAVTLLVLGNSPDATAVRANGDSRFQAETFEGLELRGIGPALMSGRIADIAIHPDRPSTRYVAVGSGNVWKTTNAGTTWEPIFDDQGSYSIGCVTLDPNRPETVWIGTGENVGGRHVGYGDGVYKSLDGGRTWSNVGLGQSEHIGNIVVDPRDSNVVYVAAQGPLWSAGGDRGLFKSTDGGGTWNKILGGGEYTGVNEVVMDPRDPEVLYAATHQRFRNVAALVNGGPESGIHKSTDGGTTWRELETGLMPEKDEEEKDKDEEEEMGKIGLAISPQDPDVVYATIERAHRKGGFYRSSDGGESWEKRNDYISGGTGPHYYQELFASPHAFDRVYQADVRMHVTEDGGETLREVPHEFMHSDSHALAFVAHDPDYLLLGCDGGLYESWDLGEHWKFVANLPVTQFYKVAVDYDEPFYNLYGGTQDNNTQGGPSRTDNVNGVRNSDWHITLFGDGHQPAVDPTNPDIVYCEWQRGNLCRYDRRTGEITYIQPQPAKGEPWDRFNWDSPILISPHDPARIYFASQRVWRSDDRGNQWRPVSGDLTRDLDRLELPMMGRVQSFDAIWDFLAMSEYGTITSLSESPVVEGLMYAATDDGLIQVTEDGGSSWRMIDQLPGVEGLFFVNDIKADLHDADVAYVCVDHHKNGDFAPYVFETTNRGKSWKSIAGDLPERHVVWRLVQDHVDPELLFVGTEFGVFFTVDGGSRWVKLTGGKVPNIPFRDLAIQRRENDLVGATFGRGFWVLDDYTPLRNLSEETLAGEAQLFPVRDAWWYLERWPLGDKGSASQGDAFFTAPNPPFGAVFTYYLRDEIRTRKKERREKEKEIAEAGGDTPYPGWVELRHEAREEEPEIVLTVRDESGEIVRRITGPVTAGFHRVAWDLRYPSPQPWDPEASDEWEEWTRGLLVAPGTYTVGLEKRVEGKLTDLGQRQRFEVVPLRKGVLPGASYEELVAFTRELDAARRDVGAAKSALDDTAERLTGIQAALMQSTADPALDGAAREMDLRLKDLRERLLGDEQRLWARDPGPVSVERRLDVAVMGNLFSTYGPTATHRENFAIAREELQQLGVELARLLESDLPALERQLDAAGVPWTPGRGFGSGGGN
jgi:photosystem II stability/assembly factor-like uncharacterized protein